VQARYIKSKALRQSLSSSLPQTHVTGRLPNPSSLHFPEHTHQPEPKQTRALPRGHTTGHQAFDLSQAGSSLGSPAAALWHCPTLHAQHCSTVPHCMLSSLVALSHTACSALQHCPTLHAQQHCSTVLHCMFSTSPAHKQSMQARQAAASAPSRPVCTRTLRLIFACQPHAMPLGRFAQVIAVAYFDANSLARSLSSGTSLILCESQHRTTHCHGCTAVCMPAFPRQTALLVLTTLLAGQLQITATPHTLPCVSQIGAGTAAGRHAPHQYCMHYYTCTILVLHAPHQLYMHHHTCTRQVLQAPHQLCMHHHTCTRLVLQAPHQLCMHHHTCTRLVLHASDRCCSRTACARRHNLGWWSGELGRGYAQSHMHWLSTSSSPNLTAGLHPQHRLPMLW